MAHSQWTRYGAAILLLVVYFALALPHLAVFPTVYEDEPWQASTAQKLAERGVFGSDLFTHMNGMEHNYYGFMPLYPLTLAVLFRAAGAGLWQARFFSVMCGAMVLALTYALTQRLWHDWRKSALAGGGVLAVRWFAETPLHPTGILFLDATRLARYDVLVPVLALAAVHTFLSARYSSKWLLFFTGVLTGLAGLAHLYGLFLLPVFFVLLGWEHPKGWGKRFAFLIGGTILTWLPYALYVLSDFPEWRAQTQGYAPRFDLLQPLWYWNNLIREPLRYAIGWHSMPLYLRAGVWFALIVIPVGMWLLGRQAIAGNRNARLLIVPILVLPVLYALLLESKFVNYLLLIVPFAAMLSGWTLVTLWERAQQTHFRRWAAVAMMLVGMMVVGEAVTRIWHENLLAATTTPYAEWSAKLHTLIPSGARVLGLPRYGFENSSYDYRAALVPLELSNPRETANPMPLSQALDAQQPEFILMDEALREYFAENFELAGAPFQAWLTQHHATMVGSVQDASYGLVEVWKVEP